MTHEKQKYTRTMIKKGSKNDKNKVRVRRVNLMQVRHSFSVIARSTELGAFAACSQVDLAPLMAWIELQSSEYDKLQT